MNVAQRILLLLGIMVVIGMGIYPPWIGENQVADFDLVHGNPGPMTRHWKLGGYSLITKPPAIKGFSVSMNVTQLATQEVVALIATAMGVLMLKDRKAGSDSQ